MLDIKDIIKFREILENCSNPLFFYDNDLDGLASFLLLRRYCGKGKGVAIKSYPDLSFAYARKIDEFSPDCVIILDKPLISKEFIQFVLSKDLEIVWLDHHPKPEEANLVKYYFNPLLSSKPSNEPVSYLSYKITERKEDMWISMLGCVSDWFIPDFAENIEKKFPDYFKFGKSVEFTLYSTKLGTIIRTLNFALKDRTSLVVNMQKTLLEINSLDEINPENKKMSSIFRRYSIVDKKYKKLLEKANKIGEKTTRLLYFQYAGTLSISSELSNELHYYFPDKIILVAYIKGTKVSCSVRGHKARDLTKLALNGIDSTSGGHEDACGATLNMVDLSKFKDNLLNLLKRM